MTKKEQTKPEGAATTGWECPPLLKYRANIVAATYSGVEPKPRDVEIWASDEASARKGIRALYGPNHIELAQVQL